MISKKFNVFYSNFIHEIWIEVLLKDKLDVTKEEERIILILVKDIERFYEEKHDITKTKLSELNHGHDKYLIDIVYLMQSEVAVNEIEQQLSNSWYQAIESYDGNTKWAK